MINKKYDKELLWLKEAFYKYSKYKNIISDIEFSKVNKKNVYMNPRAKEKYLEYELLFTPRKELLDKDGRISLILIQLNEKIHVIEKNKEQKQEANKIDELIEDILERFPEKQKRYQFFL